MFATFQDLHDVAALSRRFYRTAASADRGAIMDQMRNKAGQLHSVPFGYIIGCKTIRLSNTLNNQVCPLLCFLTVPSSFTCQ